MTTACSRCGLLHPGDTPCFSLTLPWKDAQGLQRGAMLAGRYRIERALHRGGMSLVYLAEDLVQNRLVAIKELRLPEVAGVEGPSDHERLEAEAWFARESHLLSIMQHPLIPHFYSVFREEGRSYIVQEYVAGDNLEQIVANEGPVGIDAAINWAAALCDLLTYLHDLPEPVIFRDLKPANILLRAGSQALAVVDFGIARRFAPEVVGTVVGTPGYAPPEQYQGLATPQSDIYALGATLHRLLTGYDPEHEVPFAFPPVQTLNPEVPDELATIVDRALQINPAARFADATDMGTALKHARLRPVRGSFRPSGRANVRRGAWAALAVAVLVGPMMLRMVSMPPQVAMLPVGQSGIFPRQPMLTAPDAIPYAASAGIYCSTVADQPSSTSTPQTPGSAMMAGNDGTIWFTDRAATTLSYLLPNGVLSSCPVGAGHGAVDLAGAPDASLWFVERGGDRIGHVVPLVTPPALYEIRNGGVAHAVAGGDSTLWFTQPATNTIGHIDAGGSISYTTLHSPEERPQAITRGADGTIWFTEQAGRIGYVAIDGRVGGIPIPERAAALAADQDGSLWFTESGRNAVGRIAPSGAVSEYPLPARLAGPGAIVAAPDGTIWFTETRANQIGQIDLNGQIEEFPLPAPDSQPGGMAVAGDDTVWFTELHARRLARIDGSGAIHELDVSQSAAISGQRLIGAWARPSDPDTLNNPAH